VSPSAQVDQSSNLKLQVDIWQISRHLYFQAAGSLCTILELHCLNILLEMLFRHWTDRFHTFVIMFKKFSWNLFQKCFTQMAV
jgi:hypothetical protein